MWQRKVCQQICAFTAKLYDVYLNSRLPTFKIPCACSSHIVLIVISGLQKTTTKQTCFAYANRASHIKRCTLPQHSNLTVPWLLLSLPQSDFITSKPPPLNSHLRRSAALIRGASPESYLKPLNHTLGHISLNRRKAHVVMCYPGQEQLALCRSTNVDLPDVLTKQGSVRACSR